MKLESLPVLVVDCQATSSDPGRGHLLEVAWARATAEIEEVSIETRVARLPEGAGIPERVKRLTGITEEDASRGESPEAIQEALRETIRASGLPPLVIHFAPFEKRYLEALGRMAPVLCTHAISRRLLSSLPRLGLRAVAGYFGHGVGELRRSADHVRATAEVWRGLVGLLASEAGIEDLEELLDWLSSPPPRRRSRAYPMPSSARAAAPRSPGVYRMLRSNGDVLYVGKAFSLRDRVSSYFRARAVHGEHILEMLSQARDLETVPTPTALEAALLELDEVRRLSPPYNKALRAGKRSLVFATPDLRRFSSTPDREHRVGPLPAVRLWPMMAMLVSRISGERSGSAEELFSTDESAFERGLLIFRSRWKTRSLLAHGAREWLISKEEGELELQLEVQYDAGVLPRASPEEVAESLNEVVLRASHLVRRSHWLALLGESTLVWRGRTGERIALVLEHGAVASRWDLANDEPPPEPPGALLPFPERRRRIDLEAYDRLTVLTREIRRLVREEREIALHLGGGRALARERLARILRWL